MVNYLDQNKYPILYNTFIFAQHKYSKDLNYYHTIHHVYNMLDLALKDIKYINKISDSDCFLTAIMYHDTIFKTGNPLNEKQSAEFFKHYVDILLSKSTDLISKDKVDYIMELILSTKFGEKLDTEDKKLLHDYDYMSLIDYNTLLESDYKILNEGIRDGFHFIDFINGRKSFYEYALNNDIFLSELYKQYNEQAHNNIKRRLT